MQLSRIEAAPEPSLRDRIETLLASASVQAAGKRADEIINLLVEHGHVVIGAPPAATILIDAESFAERLILTTLALRVVNMLSRETIQTPESRPARQWMDDYLAGRGHGPVGKPMLWPGYLPALANLIESWGFRPTDTTPRFVGRVLEAPILNS